MKLGVVKSPNETLALTNCVIVNPKDFNEKVKHVLIKQQYAVSIKRNDQVAVGTIACSVLQRQWAQLSLNEEVEVVYFEPSTEGSHFFISKMSLEVELISKTKKIDEPFDSAEVTAIFLKSFDGLIFSVGQLIAFDFHGINLKATVKGVQTFDPNVLGSKKADTQGIPPFRGVLNSKTGLSFLKAVGSPIEFSGSSDSTSIIAPDFKFEDLGIGGLDAQFHAIFRRAFASRIFPPQLVNKLGIKHVKGILLFGPPGTGKTLMARQIGKMLRAKEPKIVNGPEVLNKFVGQSEENIRNLFKDAEEEYKKRGDNSDLHIIIFDELDAICKQRGSKNDGTGVGDSIVNQLLSKMDGVEQLNNILVIGMTNRKDLIDEALLRSGRMEVQIEVNLPDAKGRLEILKIHTAKMRQSKLLSTEVNLESISEQTKNFSGAEIEGLIKSATSFAFNRHIEGGTMAKVSETSDKLMVTPVDFNEALKEVIPAFGVSSTEFEGTMLNGIIDFGPAIERFLNTGELFVKQVLNSDRTPLVSLLVHGPPGSGTTSLAAKIALNSQFPFIKLISPENMVTMSETAKAASIAKTFDNSYKSPLSVILIDSIEKLLEYVPIGPRFSNIVLQTLLVLLKRNPPPGHRLMIICTSSKKNLLEEMGMGDCFSGELYVPSIKTTDEIISVIKQLKVFSGDKEKEFVEALRSMKLDNHISIGVKKLLMLIEMSRQDEGRELEKLVDALQEHLAR